MNDLTREEIINDFQKHFPTLIDKYALDDIGVYEEEGEGDQYFFGYTVHKDGEVYMINLPYVKEGGGKLALQKLQWTIQAENREVKGLKSLEEVFYEIDK